MSFPVIAVVPETPSIPLSATGDVESYFRDHYARLVRSLAIVCGDGELAADAVQEAFVRAHSRWRTLRHYDDPVGWIRRVALNLVRATSHGVDRDLRRDRRLDHGAPARRNADAGVRTVPGAGVHHPDRRRRP